MEIDTGAAVSLLSQSKWQEFSPELVPTKTEVVLKTYTGECMDLVGEAEVEVRYHEQRRQLPLVIAAGSGPVLLGRDWLRRDSTGLESHRSGFCQQEFYGHPGICLEEV